MRPVGNASFNDLRQPSTDVEADQVADSARLQLQKELSMLPDGFGPKIAFSILELGWPVPPGLRRSAAESIASNYRPITAPERYRIG